MDLKFQLQIDEESRLDKMCSRLRRKQNRNHIVEDLIEVRKAKKKALLDRKNYYEYQKVPAKKSKLFRKYLDSKLRKKLENKQNKKYKNLHKERNR